MDSVRKQRPSRTAFKVAMSIITLGAKPGMDNVLPPGVVEATEKLLVVSGLVGPRAMRWSRSRRMVSVYEAFDWLLPGQFEALGERKAFFEHQVREAIAAGATQVLVLGAGFDTLGWRLAPEFPAVKFFEIDHPRTAGFKARGIKAMGPRENLFLIAEDLGNRRLVDTLTANPAWNPKDCTVFVAEGLVMYLPGDTVRDMFSQCAEIAGPGSRIAFSYIPTGADSRPDAGRWTGLMLWLQKVTGEPWIWSIRPDALGPFLMELGWQFDSALAERSGKHGVEYFSAAMKMS